MPKFLLRIADGFESRREDFCFFGIRTAPLPLGACSLKEEELQTFQVADADAAGELHSWLANSENCSTVKLIAGLPY